MHRRRELSASDRTPNFIEPQICAGGLSGVFWWRLDAKIVDKHKAWHTAAQLLLSWFYRFVKWCPSSSTLSRCYWRSCWLGTTDRYPVRSWEGEILDWPLLLFYMKRSVVCDGQGFCVHHLVVYQHYPGVLLCEAPTTLIPCWPHPDRRWIINGIVHTISIQHTNGYGSKLTKGQKEF